MVAVVARLECRRVVGGGCWGAILMFWGGLSSKGREAGGVVRVE